MSDSQLKRFNKILYYEKSINDNSNENGRKMAYNYNYKDYMDEGPNKYKNLDGVMKKIEFPGKLSSISGRKEW